MKAVLKAITPPVLVDVIRKLTPPARQTPVAPAIAAHRKAVGAGWDEIGPFQFDFLVSQGLQPEHYLLDVGCGSLRGGVHFVRYLEDGHYYGIDAQQWLLDAAREIELPQAGLADRTVHLLCRDDFDASSFGVRFDYALAQSVYSHLPWNSIYRSLVNVQKVLKPGGRFYATFFEDQGGQHKITPFHHERGGRITYPDQDPYHYEFDVFEDLARRVGLQVAYIGDWNHPRDQKMMVFRQPE
ncbi:MAG: class I SAM-dependent methyltransferase [Anaerolineae bacterium]|nr:class I SAM-dependent methyltransferase [Anaerolineae bacterium]